MNIHLPPLLFTRGFLGFDRQTKGSASKSIRFEVADASLLETGEVPIAMEREKREEACEPSHPVPSLASMLVGFMVVVGQHFTFC